MKRGGVGANRLPIVDEVYGVQPSSNKDKTIFAVMNGEIFNHISLRKRLREKGYSFLGNSDTELIPALYEEYGEHFTEHIDSDMYSIVIFDKRDNSWIVARDSLGVKPLYFAETEGKTYFSSELKQLAWLDDINRIEIFPPGAVYRNGNFVKKRKFITSPVLNPDEASVQKIRNLFDEAVEKRIPQGEKFGILLSGGIDSSSVLVTALKYTKKENVLALIVGGENSSDRKFAVKLCHDLNVDYKIIEPRDLTIDAIKELIKVVETDEKNTIRHSWVSYLACEQGRREGFKVLLSGEGADEVFGGYNIFRKIPDELNQKARRLLVEDLHLSQLPRVDRTGMRFTQEIRVPFLDTELVEFALNLKTTSLGGKNTKEILRLAMSDRLPREFTSREKTTFSAGAGVSVDDENNVFQKVIEKIGEKEQEFIDEYFRYLGYNKVIKKKAINKDNLLEILSI